MNAAICALAISEYLGNIGAVQAILFILGLFLLILEIFVPGFGVSGGLGIVLLLVGIFMTAQTPFEAFLMILILILLVAVLLFIILRSAKKGKLSKKLILKSASKREEGFTSTTDTSALIGKEGVALTLLRPAGTGEFENKRIDVVSEGDFIEPGTKIKIITTEGRRIVVKPTE